MLPSFSPAVTAAAMAPPPPKPIPGGYGAPVLGPLRDRLDYFWFQGPEEFFRRRAAQHRSTVFRANIPPTFPFFVGINPRVIAIVDTAAFTALFDPELVDKRDCLIGPYNPSDSFSGGTRVGVYLDTEEPEHERTKAFAMDLLRRSSRVWAPEFLEGVDGMLADIESDLAAGKEGGASFLVPLQRCIFRFLCRSVASADPAAEGLVDRYGLFILDVWLGLQLLPTQKVGAIPQPLEELLLHSFPFPSILVKPGYDLLYRFLATHGAESVAVGVNDHGMSEKDAINNILFLLGFNAFGGFSVFLPFLILQIGKDAALRARLRDEVRAALDQHDGEVGFASVKGCRWTSCCGRTAARVLGGRRGDAVRVPAAGDEDPEVFERPEEFVADRFVGAGGEALLRYVYWSNGPETGEPTLGNKQCAGKDVVVATACMLVAELFRRYDDFECTGTAFTSLKKRPQPQPS
ncbi:hypothetical protein ZWY2020_015508 [Hordeum vulgare]|nr:hypothetical protein ZWY2020_015508 [Hordeum vulgare]